MPSRAVSDDGPAARALRLSRRELALALGISFTLPGSARAGEGGDGKDTAPRRPAQPVKRPPGMTDEEYERWRKKRERKKREKQDLADLLGSDFFDPGKNP
jgi:hypothetical protein